ncbi:hypothetical protein [Bradyrhizobium monzae]|nr:hypothetical protein [Bradyrhizobium sp. Oc8]
MFSSFAQGPPACFAPGTSKLVAPGNGIADGGAVTGAIGFPTKTEPGAN